MEKIIKEVVGIIKEINENITIKDTDYDIYFNNLGIDSLDMSSILLEIEEKYEFSIPDEAIKDISTINKLAKYIKDRTN